VLSTGTFPEAANHATTEFLSRLQKQGFCFSGRPEGRNKWWRWNITDRQSHCRIVVCMHLLPAEVQIGAATWPQSGNSPEITTTAVFGNDRWVVSPAEISERILDGLQRAFTQARLAAGQLSPSVAV
jgi:hypothetical protein